MQYFHHFYQEVSTRLNQRNCHSVLSSQYSFNQICVNAMLLILSAFTHVRFRACQVIRQISFSLLNKIKNCGQIFSYKKVYTFWNLIFISPKYFPSRYLTLFSLKVFTFAKLHVLGLVCFYICKNYVLDLLFNQIWLISKVCSRRQKSR